MLDSIGFTYGRRYLCRSGKCQIQGEVKNPIGDSIYISLGSNVKSHGDRSEIVMSVDIP